MPQCPHLRCIESIFPALPNQSYYCVASARSSIDCITLQPAPTTSSTHRCAKDTTLPWPHCFPMPQPNYTAIPKHSVRIADFPMLAASPCPFFPSQTDITLGAKDMKDIKYKEESSLVIKVEKGTITTADNLIIIRELGNGIIHRRNCRC